MIEAPQKLDQKAYLLLAAPVRKGFSMLLGGACAWLLYDQSGDYVPAAIVLAGFFTLAGLPESWRMLAGLCGSFAAARRKAPLMIIVAPLYFTALLLVAILASVLGAPFTFATSLIAYAKAARAARRMDVLRPGRGRDEAPVAAAQPPVAPVKIQARTMPAPDLPPVVSGKDRPLGF